MTKIKYYLAAFIVLLPVLLWAQTNLTNSVPAPATVPSAQSAQGLLLALIPVLVPVLVSMLKYFSNSLPAWSLPIIAAGLGEAINYISGLSGGPSTSALNGVFLGAAGVGLREVLDQVKGRVQNGAPVSVNKNE